MLLITKQKAYMQCFTVHRLRFEHAAIMHNKSDLLASFIEEVAIWKSSLRISQLSIKLTYPILHLDLTLSLLEKIQSAREVEPLWKWMHSVELIGGT